MSNRAQDIFGEICDLPVDQRQQALEQAAGGDDGLRAEVETLLNAHDAAGRFMAEPTVDQTPTSVKLSEGAGTEIDRYKLLEEIGEGGFGVVYMAQQTAPVRRRVALKIIKLGMDTKQVVARFEAERQALAMMDHPNIARVLDGGATQSGRPYFVMELVRGDPITEHCDRERLPTEQRLGLFQQVCNAVQHAHQKGIIHRDIKPSNVLVTIADGKPLVKVIDFGIAKATNQELTEKTLFTEFRQLIGTPQYMSPEQAERSGVDVDTRSDIYSLGVLLYEFLTGRTPIDPKRIRSAQWAELQRMIREEEPTKPSVLVTSLGADAADLAKRRSTEVARLGGALRGDLDWIVLRALEKDRTRRYATASQMADDIGRFLGDQPVEASPPSAAYRLRKFAKRNRQMIGVASLLIGLLMVGLIATSVTSLWATRERRRALHAEQLAQQRAREASHLADRAKRFAAMAGSPLPIFTADEKQRLSDAWGADVNALRDELGLENEEVVRAEAQYAAWVFYQQLPDAIQLMRDVHDRARRLLGFADVTFLAFANAHTFAQAYRPQDDSKIIVPLWEDVIKSTETIHGAGACTYMLPEYAAALHKAGEDGRAADVIKRYLDDSKITSPIANAYYLMKLNFAIENLATWGAHYPELYDQVRLFRDRALAGSTAVETDQKLSEDLQLIQGKWEASNDTDGKLETMTLEVAGSRALIYWLDEQANITRGTEGEVQLSHNGPCKVLTLKATVSTTTILSLPYHIDNDNQFTTAMGFASANEGDPRLQVWKRTSVLPSDETAKVGQLQ